MKLCELFQPNSSVVPGITWKKGVENEHFTNYEVTVDNATGDSSEFVLHISKTYLDGIVEVSFAILQGGSVSFDIVGRQREFAVFAAMADALRQHVASHPEINGFYFSSSQDSRSRAYGIMAKRMSMELGWKNDQAIAKLLSYEYGDGTIYWMIIKPEIAKKVYSIINNGL